MPSCTPGNENDEITIDGKLAVNHNADRRLICMECGNPVSSFETPSGGLVRAVVHCPECWDRITHRSLTILRQLADTGPITPRTCADLGFEMLRADPNIWYLDQGDQVLSVVFTSTGEAIVPALDSFPTRNAGQLAALCIATSRAQ